jgi:hypothetical protein
LASGAGVAAEEGVLEKLKAGAVDDELPKLKAISSIS